MSKPNYLRKGDAPSSIIIKVEGLITYLFNITNNEKQFPKAYRYTLVTDIRNTALDLHKNVSKALAVHPRFKKEFKRRREYQDAAYMNLIDLKSLLVVALNTVSIANPEYVALQMEIVMNGYVKWVRNDKRNYRHLPSKKEYNEYRRALQEKRKLIKMEWANLEKDEDGFVVLRRKD